MFVKPAANIPLLLLCKKRVQSLNQVMSAQNGYCKKVDWHNLARFVALLPSALS